MNTMNLTHFVKIGRFSIVLLFSTIFLGSAFGQSKLLSERLGYSQLISC